MVAAEQSSPRSPDPVCVCGHGRSLHRGSQARAAGEPSSGLCQGCDAIRRQPNPLPLTLCTGFSEQGAERRG